MSALGIALQRVDPDITAHVRFCPFELNPAMEPEGQDRGEHLTQKYGSMPEQQAEIRATIVNRRHLISGGQPPEAFEQALRQITAELVA